MKFTHDVIKINEDFDEIVEIISELCFSEKVLLHVREDHQFNLVSAVGASNDLNSELSIMLKQVLEEGEFQSQFKVDGNQFEYLGMPIVNDAQKLLGVLSFVSHKKLTLNSNQNKTIRVFFKSMAIVIGPTPPGTGVI